MPLLDFWKSSPTVVEKLSIEQIVANAGDGALKDNSICGSEFREYISLIPSQQIARYVEHCLSYSFSKSGMVLQDLINELGRRLDYKVTNGLYQGTTNKIGFDGIWLSPENHTIILEVKTTDAYRISLDTLAAYRSKLTATNQIGANSSILIVVGRDDTGELEAQVRGSRHAWDIRLISADALIKLVQIKENTDGEETGLKIRSLLAPLEYTRLDRMIDVVFTAAKEVEAAAIVAEADVEEGEKPTAFEQEQIKGVWQFTEAGALQEQRDKIISAASQHLKLSLIKKSRALYWSSNHQDRLICTISKRYIKKGGYRYWYAYHPQWHKFLQDGQNGFLVLGCMDLALAFAIPAPKMGTLLDALNTTTKDDGQMYWHMHVTEQTPSIYRLLLPKHSTSLDLHPFALVL